MAFSRTGSTDYSSLSASAPIWWCIPNCQESNINNDIVVDVLFVLEIDILVINIFELVKIDELLGFLSFSVIT